MDYKKVKILLAAVLVAVAVSAVIFCFWFNYEINSIPEDPKEYVNNMTVDNNWGLFYKERIVRYPLKAAVIPLMFNESLRIGISVDRTQLDFGLVTKGLNVNKVLEFKNEYHTPARVNVVAYGGVKPLITVQDKSFMLKEGEQRNIVITMNSTEVGKYSGELDVIIRVPSYEPLVYIMK